MPDDSTDDSKSLPVSRILPGPAHLRTYPAHDLVAWQPQGVLDDRLLDEIGEWLCDIEKAWSPLRRFVDFSRLTEVAVRTSHVFEFARKRAEQFPEGDAGEVGLVWRRLDRFWHCLHVRRSDEGNVDRCARISRPREGRRLARCTGGGFETRRCTCASALGAVSYTNFRRLGYRPSHPRPVVLDHDDLRVDDPGQH